MLTIIEIQAREDGGHGLQSQSHRTECWLDGWVAVPPELESAVWACGGYCTLDLDYAEVEELTENGNPTGRVSTVPILLGITPTERPPEAEPEPSEADILKAFLGV